MTAREFERALHDLGRNGDAAFAQRTPEAWTEELLRHQPGRDRRAAWIGRTGLALLLAGFLTGLAGLVLWDGPVGELLVKLCPLSLLPLIQFASGPSITPLLIRLDDVRLVPLWLDALSPGKSKARSALLERLTRRLPEWRETYGALPPTAASRLRYTVERLCKRPRLGAEACAFVVAALPSLAVAADAREALDRLRAATDDATVQAAADEALLRIRS